MPVPSSGSGSFLRWTIRLNDRGKNFKNVPRRKMKKFSRQADQVRFCAFRLAVCEPLDLCGISISRFGFNKTKPTAKKHAPLFQAAFLFMLVLAFSGFLSRAVAVEASGPTLANDQVAYHWAPAQQGGGLIGIEDRRRWCLVFNLKLLAVIGRNRRSSGRGQWPASLSL